jgi:hypothetical protein
MPLVVLDPVVLVNTGKVPDGPSAKLLTLLAYGRAIGYLNGGADAEAQWLGHWLSTTPPGLGQDWASADGDAYAYTFAARKALVESIPAQGRSFDWCLALSKSLIDQVVRRIGRLRDSEDLELDAGIVAAAVSVHAARWIAEDWDSTPDYTATGDTDANVSIHTALRAGAPLVITKLADACEPENPKMYYPIDADQGYPSARRGRCTSTRSSTRSVRSSTSTPSMPASWSRSLRRGCSAPRPHPQPRRTLGEPDPPPRPALTSAIDVQNAGSRVRVAHPCAETKRNQLK